MLDPGDTGQIRELPQRAPAERLPGPVGDVVDDDGNVASRRQCREVLADAGLAGTVVVGHYRQRRADLRPRGQAGQRPGRCRRVVRACARDQRCRALAADPAADVQHDDLLIRGKGWTLSRGAEGDDSGRSVVKDPVRQLLEWAGSELAIGRERGNQRHEEASQFGHVPILPALYRSGPVHIRGAIRKLT